MGMAPDSGVGGGLVYNVDAYLRRVLGIGRASAGWTRSHFVVRHELTTRRRAGILFSQRRRHSGHCVHTVVVIINTFHPNPLPFPP